jgi:hypothetical protein
MEDEAKPRQKPILVDELEIEPDDTREPYEPSAEIKYRYR